MLWIVPLTGHSQDVKSEKYKTIIIKTSAQCEQCKERIESVLAFEKGIKSSKLDLETKQITVVFQPAKTDPETIKKTISKTGYDADDVRKDEKAYNKIPECCKLPGESANHDH
jgi:copper chaperone CopZ